MLRANIFEGTRVKCAETESLINYSYHYHVSDKCWAKEHYGTHGPQATKANNFSGHSAGTNDPRNMLGTHAPQASAIDGPLGYY